MVHKLMGGLWRYELIQHVLEFTLFAMYKITEIYEWTFALQTSSSLRVHQMCTAKMHIFMSEIVQGGNMNRISRVLDTTSLYEERVKKFLYSILHSTASIAAELTICTTANVAAELRLAPGGRKKKEFRKINLKRRSWLRAGAARVARAGKKY